MIVFLSLFLSFFRSLKIISYVAQLLIAISRSLSYNITTVPSLCDKYNDCNEQKRSVYKCSIGPGASNWLLFLSNVTECTAQR